MKQTSFLVLSLVATLLAQPAQAVTMLDNTTQYATELSAGNVYSMPTSAYADSTAAGYNKVASAFTTGTTNLTLDSVTLLLNPSVNISLSSAALTVSIYSNTSVSSYYLNEATGLNNNKVTTTPVSHPFASIELLTAAGTTRPNPTNAGTAFTWNATGGFLLNANTTYWIVVGSTDTSGYYNPVVDLTGANAPASSTSGLTTDWSVRSGTTAASVDFAAFTQTGGIYGSNDATVAANSWLSWGDSPLFFKIDASTAGAPEPSKALLTMLGMLSLGFQRSRRR